MKSLPLRVLIADDEHTIADVLARFLVRHGHEVRVAYDGLEAIRLARDFLPHVALLDINMPGLDGYSVAQQMRQDPKLTWTILVALSAWSNEEHKLRCLEAGFHRQIEKPYSLHAVSEILDTLAATNDGIAEVAERRRGRL
jgi:CheY-like chemotaxis protein